MMHLLSALFFAISSSGDSFVVGISYGIKKVRINFLNNILVAVISGLGTILSMFFGKFIRNFISNYYANMLGSWLLIALGIYMLISSLRNKSCIPNNCKGDTKHYNGYRLLLDNPDLLDINNSKNIELNEAVSLGFVLCLNNIGLGIGASIAGLNPILTSSLTVIASIIFVPLGCFIGEKLVKNKTSNYTDIFAAFLIIILGIYELFL
jgi:putative sporulation protein YtaF